MIRSLACVPVLLALASLGCGTSTAATTHDAGTAPSDAGAPVAEAGEDAGTGDASIDKTVGCAGTFGSAIGAVGFARFDGTVVAVLPPGNTTCAAPNSTHLVLELSFSGAVYRMVVDVDDTASPGTIHIKTIAQPLVGGPWSDGWHAVPLDYVTNFGLHSSDFAAAATADAVAATTAALTLGAHVSVFATAQGEADSAHLVHRNLAGQDGAIVVNVDGAPTWLLFSFSDQSF
jgi:hypothetical protein